MLKTPLPTPLSSPRPRPNRRPHLRQNPRQNSRPRSRQTALAGVASALIIGAIGIAAPTAHAGPNLSDNLSGNLPPNSPTPPSLILSQQRDLVCLAMNIYHEGRGESARGQAAIAAVTMNRMRSPRYPNSVCAVVWQRKQFSWTRLRAHHHVIDDAQAWQKALTIAELFLGGARLALVSEATHYHTVDVRPFWSKDIRAIATIGKHLFYAL